MTSPKVLLTDTYEQIWALFIPVKETTNGHLHFISGPFSGFYLSHCVFFFWLSLECQCHEKHIKARNDHRAKRISWPTGMFFFLGME